MKVGVIGLGGMGRHHAKVIRKFDFVAELLGCDQLPKAREAGAKDGIRSVADIPSLLAWRPDAVIVVTQASAHAGAIEPCLKAGIPVLTEKPLTTDLRASRRLVALAEKRRLNFQVGFELRYCGATLAMKAVVASGLIGKPLHASLVQISGSHGKGAFTMERTGGIFYEKLCHQIDFYRFWLGEPERVMAIAAPKAMKHYGVPDTVLSCLVFPGGRTGNITFMTTRAAQIGGTSDHGDRGHFYELTLTCTRGSVTFDAWDEVISVVRFNHRPDCKSELVERFKVRERYGEPVYDLERQDGDFLKRVAAGKPPTFPASDALKTMEWVALAEASLASGGKWIAG